MSLTVRQVETAKPKDKPYKLADERGLYLYVAPTGTKSWRANYKANGKQQTRTYGRWPAMTLQAARKAHGDAKEAPATATEDRSPPFREAAKGWLRKHLPSLSNPKHRLQVENTLENFVYPHIGDDPIKEIPRKKLTDTVKAVQVSSPKQGQDDRLETAHRVAGRITAVFNHYADEVGWDNHPAANLSRVLSAKKTKAPMPCIRWQDAGELLRAILSYPEPVTQKALLLLAHTFVRPGREFRLMGKDEFKESGDIWVIPEERMKLRLPHVVPMSRQSKKLVAELSAMSGCQLVIESPAQPGHPLSENTLLFALYRLGYRGRMTAHGFRALASTVLNEQSGFPHDVIERQLAHKETDAVRAAYNRAEYLDQRRKLMQWWSDWLDAQLVEP